MSGIAMLGMYDMPGVDAANDALWAAMRETLGHGPKHLTRDADFWEIWRAPDLILGQTCGFPYRAKLHGTVQLLGTPDYDLPDCPPGMYRSVFLCRESGPISELADVSGCSFAFNEAMSQSGWAAPQHMMGQSGVQAGSLVETGSHAASLQAVAEGEAEFAAVDLHTLRLLTQQGLLPQGLRVFAQTDPTPGLPYICSASQNAEDISAALRKAIGTSGTQALGLKALVQIAPSTYLSVPTPPSPAQTGLPHRQLTGHQP